MHRYGTENHRNGVPYYLNMLDSEESLIQNVDHLLFSQTGELRDEYNFVFRSLFEEYTIYHKIVELLSKKKKGMTREELQQGLKISSGGNFTDALNNLQNCDFIRKYHCLGKKQRDALYQLTDCFTYFYLSFVSDFAGQDESAWSNMIDNPKKTAWMGYAFEQVCLLHLPQIKQALGISGILTDASAWVGSDGEEKGQIDLVIDRRDRTINLCEMKYSMGLYEITKAYHEKLRSRMSLFKRVTGTTKSLVNTMVTTYGIKRTKYCDVVNRIVTMDDLFL